MVIISKQKMFNIVLENNEVSLEIEEGLSKLVNSSDEEKEIASKSIKRETKKVIDMLKVDKNMNTKNSDEILSILKSIQVDVAQLKTDMIEVKADIKDLKERVTIIEEKLERNNIR